MALGPDILQRAANAPAPLAISAGGGGRIVLSVSDTVARFQIPSFLSGRRVMLTMDGSHADLLFGKAAVVVDYGKASGVSAEVITRDEQSGMHLSDNVARPVDVPTAKEATHFSVDCKGSGSGKLYIDY